MGANLLVINNRDLFESHKDNPPAPVYFAEFGSTGLLARLISVVNVNLIRWLSLFITFFQFLLGVYSGQI